MSALTAKTRDNQNLSSVRDNIEHNSNNNSTTTTAATTTTTTTTTTNNNNNNNNNNSIQKLFNRSTQSERGDKKTIPLLCKLSRSKS